MIEQPFKKVCVCLFVRFLFLYSKLFVANWLAMENLSVDIQNHFCTCMCLYRAVIKGQKPITSVMAELHDVSGENVLCYSCMQR